MVSWLSLLPSVECKQWIRAARADSGDGWLKWWWSPVLQEFWTLVSPLGDSPSETFLSCTRILPQTGNDLLAAQCINMLLTFSKIFIFAFPTNIFDTWTLLTFLLHKRTRACWTWRICKHLLARVCKADSEQPRIMLKLKTFAVALSSDISLLTFLLPLLPLCQICIVSHLSDLRKREALWWCKQALKGSETGS